MYVPASFAVSDEKTLESFLERYDFATLTSSSSAGLVSSHIPLMLRRSAGRAVLIGHVARANSQWQQFDGEAEALAIFHGPHAYVSPTWYATSPAVPTWNYAAVHVYGKPRARAEGDFTATALRDLVGRHEGSRAKPWRPEDLAGDLFEPRVEHCVVEPLDDRPAVVAHPVLLPGRQLGQLLGARVIITSSSDHKLARAKALGAAAGINYTLTPDWPGAVMELTDGVGADYVVDTVGGLKDAIAAVRLGGTVAFVGLLSGMTAELDLVAFMGKCARVEAVDVGSRATFEAMNTAIAFHGIRPVVDRVFAFDELGTALTYLSEGRHFGKVGLRV